MIDLTVQSIASPPSNEARIGGLPLKRIGQSGVYQPYLANINAIAPVMDWVSATSLRLIRLNDGAGPSSVLVADFRANARVKVNGVFNCAAP